jgi:DNA-directed RNA polymerase
MIQLDGGVILPDGKGKGFAKPDGISPNKWQTMKPEMWERAYLHCLYSLPIHFDLPLHSVVPRLAKKMLEASDPFNVALRFMGEMEIAGYVEFERGMDERIVQPTKKFLSLDLDCERAPTSAITFPKMIGEGIPRSPIRGGVRSAKNDEVADITSEIASQEFEVNQHMLDLTTEFPPQFDKTSSAYMYKRAMKSSKTLGSRRFRFPYFLDSRSRTYTDTTCGITPQGADHEKALVIPTYAEKLTPSGLIALIEAANGYSELDFTQEDMCRHINDPKGYHHEWSKSDKPYSYLACAALVYRHSKDPNEPLPAFKPLDGRCSGLQHWSAVVRSNAITRHLGMHIDEADLDIYEKVAADWRETLEPEWQYLATRKAAKIPVMTWGYNATMMTSMEHIGKLYGAKSKWDDNIQAYVTDGKGLERGVTSKFGAQIYRQLQDTLGPLQGAVSWVSDCAVLISKIGNVEIRWPTPDGFTCMQRKVKGETKDLACTLSDDSRFQLDILDFSKDTPNTGKHRSAIAPNIIHSLDATHLRMVARRLKELGLPMIFIHDSFATHCNHEQALYDIIVDTFIELYSMDYLQDLKKYWEELYGVELDDPPELGEWKPESIRGLKRFFL